MRSTIESPAVMPFMEMATSRDQHNIRLFAGKVGASQVPDALVFIDENMIQLRPEALAVFAEPEEYRPQSIDLRHSILLDFSTHATIVLPPLNLWTPAQLIETLTLKHGHMSYSAREKLNASNAVRRAHKQAYELRQSC